jgi:hypothetical protein
MAQIFQFRQDKSGELSEAREGALNPLADTAM